MRFGLSASLFSFSAASLLPLTSPFPTAFLPHSSTSPFLPGVCARVTGKEAGVFAPAQPLTLPAAAEYHQQNHHRTSHAALLAS